MSRPVSRVILNKRFQVSFFWMIESNAFTIFAGIDITLATALNSGARLKPRVMREIKGNPLNIEMIALNIVYFMVPKYCL